MTERLIEFNLEAAKADPSRVRHYTDGLPAPTDTLFAKDGSVHLQIEAVWRRYANYEYDCLRLTAPAPKRVEVRAALWTSGRFTLWFKDFNIAETDDQFVRWLTNWHIEGNKVFVEVE